MGSRLGLLALLVHIVLPLGQAFAAPAADDKEGSLASALRVICSAYGTKTLPAPDGGEQDPATGSSSNCPVCLSYGIGKAMKGPEALVLPLPRATATAAYVARTEQVPAGRIDGLASARAPPVTL